VTLRSRPARISIALALLLVAQFRAAAQLNDSQHVKLTVGAPAQVRTGEQFEVSVKLAITQGFHIQSNRPAANYVPTVVKVSGPRGYTFGEPMFPDSIMARAAGEMIPVFEGTVEVKVPAVAPKSESGPAQVNVVCSYQACDEGSCFPPSEVTGSATISASGSARVSAGTRPPEGGRGGTLLPDGTRSQRPPNGQGVSNPRGGQAAPQPVGSSGTSPAGPGPNPPGSGAQMRGYAMAKVTRFVEPEEFVRFLEGGVDEGAGEGGTVTRLLNSGNLLLALPLIFLLGLALNLTPCVYPIIPITVSYFGAQAGGEGRKPFVLALFYVLGMALMYSGLGVAAGLTGGLFGSQLQNPWVLLAFGLVMFGLALSQFDRRDGRPIWEFQLPGFLRNRAQSRSGVLGALAMGLMVGVVAAPCIGPAVIALLQWVGTQQSPVMGFAVFFSLALGLGLPYLFLATASGGVKSLPRAGEWMIGIKHIFGVVLIWMGAYYLQSPLALWHPIASKTALVAVSALSALYLLVLDRSGGAARGFVAVKRLAGLAALGVTLWLLVPAPAERIEWRPYTEQALNDATAARRPVLIDFTAKWCAACQELERKTFSDERVGKAARRFVALRGDMTNFGGQASMRWRDTYGIKGLPTIVRLEPR